MDDTHYEDEDQAPQPRRFRLLPLTTVMLSLLLVIKVNELYIGSQTLRELYAARSAEASGAEKKEEAKPAADAAHAEPAKEEKAAAHGEEKKPDEAAAHATDEKAADGKEVKKEEAAAPTEEKKEDAAHAAPAKDEKAEAHGEAKPEEKKEEGGHGGSHGEAEKPVEEPKTFGTGKSTIKEIEAMKAKNDPNARFSKSEIDLLENLSKRRDELDKREKELDIKSKVLEATQKRIDDRLQEMKTLDAQLSKIVAVYDEKQNAQISSLVKIYENMKPSQAAGIFNELDMPILLEVIDKMSERKVAPVLAQMNPRKARDVTQELAAMRKSAPKVPASVKP
jgi:flagellar motility protein MotE (MotC chaperone)